VKVLINTKINSSIICDMVGGKYGIPDVGGNSRMF